MQIGSSFLLNKLFLLFLYSSPLRRRHLGLFLMLEKSSWRRFCRINFVSFYPQEMTKGKIIPYDIYLTRFFHSLRIGIFNLIILINCKTSVHFFFGGNCIIFLPSRRSDNDSPPLSSKPIKHLVASAGKLTTKVPMRW